MKPSVSHLCVLFCPCVVWKSTAHVGRETLNMCQQAQKGFWGIFVGIPQNQKNLSCVRTECKESNIFL